MVKDKDDYVDGTQTRFLVTRWYSRLARASATHRRVHSCVIYTTYSWNVGVLFIYWHKDVTAL